MIKAEIQNIRSKIDQIDDAIAKLLSDRILCSKKIGLLKEELKKSSETDIIGAYDPIRENQIVEQLKAKHNSIPFNGIETIFRQIISLCRNSSHKSNICLFGKFENFDYKSYFGSFCGYNICSDVSSWIKELTKDKYNIGLTDFLLDEKTNNELNLLGFEEVLISNKNLPIKVYFHK